jgi:mevalonate kinase
MQLFSASCKLMLFGEYLILRGSKSLAFPLKFEQRLEVTPSENLSWKSSSPHGVWFEASFDENLNLIASSNEDTAILLQAIFLKIKELKPSINLNNNFFATADFQLEWGLGSSSTLLSLLSQWSKTDAYLLLEASFGGSGYDIACATAKTPIIYEVKDRKTQNICLSSAVTDHFLFVYLGEKQSSRTELKRFEKSEVLSEHVKEMNQLIQIAVNSAKIEEFENCMNSSEQLLSTIIGKQTLKEHIFTDYSYSIKSLGAWGGDFFLATYRDLEKAKTYFTERGLTTFFTYNEMVKN